MPQLERSAALQIHAPAFDLGAGVLPKAGNEIEMVGVHRHVGVPLQIFPKVLHTVFDGSKLALANLPSQFTCAESSRLVQYCCRDGVARCILAPLHQHCCHADVGGVDKDVSIVGEIIGFFLLSAYIVSDSFTSQWQSKLYADYGKIDSFQMMFGVNLSSIVITTIAMIFAGDIPVVIELIL